MSRRVAFDFRQRVEMARIYLDDGALVTCADRLEALARDIRAHAEAERRAFNEQFATPAGAV